MSQQYFTKQQLIDQWIERFPEDIGDADLGETAIAGYVETEKGFVWASYYLTDAFSREMDKFMHSMRNQFLNLDKSRDTILEHMGVRLKGTDVYDLDGNLVGTNFSDSVEDRVYKPTWRKFVGINHVKIRVEVKV